LCWFTGATQLEHIHPLEAGYLRRKVRTDRRPGMKIENPLTFYPKYVFDLAAKHVGLAKIIWQLARVRSAIKRDPNASAYMDTALTPVTDDDLETLEMFSVTDSAKGAADHARKVRPTAVVTAAE
jgi:hypothetical protein